MVTTYRITNIKDYEEFMNNLFNGLKYYQKTDSRFQFKLNFSKDTITLKTIKLHAPLN